MSTKTIAIVGITGTQGASVAETYLKDPHWRVRGVVRDPAKPKAQEWLKRNVELVRGDLDDTESLVAAFKGANVVFGMTDFWSAASSKAFTEQVQRRGQQLNEACYEAEFKQGRNLVDAVAATAAESGGELQRFILSTLSGTRGWSHGEIDYNLHFDSKWDAVVYLREVYPDLDRITSLLQLGLFMTNWKGRTSHPGAGYAPVKQEDQTYLVSLPMGEDTVAPWVHPYLDTGTFVKALVEAEPGKSLLGCGSELTMKEYCEAFGTAHNVKAYFRRIPAEQLDTMIPGGVGKELAAMFQYIEKFGYDGGDPSVIRPSDLGIQAHQMTSIETYFRTEDFSAIL